MADSQDGLYTGWKSPSYCDRGTLDLLYACDFTIYLCCWAAVHLNVPADEDSVRTRTLRKIKWMFICLIMPEYIAWDAVEELWEARLLVKEFRTLAPLQQWTLAHAFLLKMGGISLTTPTGDMFRPSVEHFLLLVRSGQVVIPELHRQDIEDKSKADWIVKALAVVQILHFAVGLLGRVLERLPVSTLEIFTVIIISSTLLTYACWWHKPKDVNRPFRFSTTASSKELSNCLTGDMYARFRAPGKRIALTDSNASERTKKGRQYLTWATFLLVTSVFGPMHALAWNYRFPTEAEQILWRVATVICSVLPFLVVPVLPPAVQRRLGRWGRMAALVVVALSLVMYVLLRLYLLTESLASLRTVPSGVYRVLRWSAALPGIGA